MIELKSNQIIQTKNGVNYILKNILPKYGGVTAITEDNCEYFIHFKDFMVVQDSE